MQPELYRPGSFFFREDYKQAYPEMINQLVFFPAWGADDFPDLIEKAVSFCNLRLPESVPKPGQGKTITGAKTISTSLSSGKKNW